jgi:predicted nucleotidyltransferase component of viral defense system
MTKWLKLNTEERNDILGLFSNKTGLLAYVVEKDWWVTSALYAIFRTEWKNNIVFKGGNSLSKCC